MIYRLLSFLLLTFTVIGCGKGGSAFSYDTKTIDTTKCFFSGEFTLQGTTPYFTDCATSKLMTLESKQMVKITTQYSRLNNDNTAALCTLKGFYSAEKSAVVVTDFIGFNMTESCAPTKLNRTYAAANADTLTLLDSYTYCMTSKSKAIKGRWARMYDDSGVLILDGKNAIPFTINFGNEENNNNLFLSFKDTDGKGVVFLPVQ
ncbi:MAG: hypothetical protein RR277_02380 [Rikenellaceae bacterium]